MFPQMFIFIEPTEMCRGHFKITLGNVLCESFVYLSGMFKRMLM